MYFLYFRGIATLRFHFGCSGAFKSLPRHLFDVDLINFRKRKRISLERYAITRFVLWFRYTFSDIASSRSHPHTLFLPIHPPESTCFTMDCSRQFVPPSPLSFIPRPPSRNRPRSIVSISIMIIETASTLI